jgi:epoxyqueuosine reductase
MHPNISHTEKIKRKALDLGFDDVGISKAAFLEKESRDLENWLKEGMHGEMAYMENHVEKRTDPRKLVEGAKSIISVALNYFDTDRQPPNTYKISRYAYGRDYHDVVREKLNRLYAFIKTLEPAANGRIFVDSAPVMEKAWAAQSGLGWIGKNTNLVSSKHGSFLFIGEIILDSELDYDAPVQGLCGTCTRCIDACPTKALTPYKLDARKCISYLTIEKKGNIPDAFKNQWHDWIFGCDICQNVCPWNARLKPHHEDRFFPGPEIATYLKSDWENLTQAGFKRIFEESPLERAKWKGIQKNIRFLQKTNE